MSETPNITTDREYKELHDALNILCNIPQYIQIESLKAHVLDKIISLNEMLIKAENLTVMIAAEKANINEKTRAQVILKTKNNIAKVLHDEVSAISHTLMEIVLEIKNAISATAELAQAHNAELYEFLDIARLEDSFQIDMNHTSRDLKTDNMTENETDSDSFWNQVLQLLTRIIETSEDENKRLQAQNVLDHFYKKEVCLENINEYNVFYSEMNKAFRKSLESQETLEKYIAQKS